MAGPEPATARSRGTSPAQDENHGAFRQQLVASIPKLRAFALSLASHADYADDLVQETLMKAWHHQHSFQAGTKSASARSRMPTASSPPMSASTPSRTATWT